MKKYIALLIPFLTIGCSSFFIRQECGNINWHQRGYDIAMSGRRVTGDETIKRCMKAEYNVPESEVDLGFKEGMMNYCKASTAYSIGKEGNAFNPDFCDSADVYMLRKKHAEGVDAYCTKDNAMAVGVSGKRYTQICPKNLEEKFLVEYRKGRKKFLENSISINQTEIQTIESSLSSLRRDESILLAQLDSLPRPYTITEHVYDSETKLTREVTRTEDPAWNTRMRLDEELGHISSRMRSERDRQSSLRTAINESQKELVSLQ